VLSKKAWKWRLKWLKEGVNYLISGEDIEDKANLVDRLKFFLGTLRIFLPLPGRISKRQGIKFTLGLRYLKDVDNGKIYEKNGVKFFIPKNFLYEFFKMYKGIIIQKHYEEAPVVVNRGDIIIDCGANLGLATIFFAKKAGRDGLVIAVEPEESNFLILQKIAELNKGSLATIIPIKKAVYKENTILEFCITRKTGHHFLAIYGGEQRKILKKQKVEAITIDELVKELGLKRVDFIKMDIEGAEIDALLGAEKTIKTYHPKLAICSYHRETDSDEIKRIIHLFNPNYEIKELEKGERVIFAWDPRFIS